jgi:excinuclease ABC subunit A
MDAATHIHIKGAREHNLQNLELRHPARQTRSCITGPSGSGKSSLAFDTIYAEGYRKYMESLSSAAARQVLEQLKRPDVDFIHGLSPVLAIEQRSRRGLARAAPMATVDRGGGLCAVVVGGLRRSSACPKDGGLVEKRSLDDCRATSFIARLAPGNAPCILAPWMKAKPSVLRDELPRLQAARDSNACGWPGKSAIARGSERRRARTGAGRRELAVELVVDRLVQRYGRSSAVGWRTRWSWPSARAGTGPACSRRKPPEAAWREISLSQHAERASSAATRSSRSRRGTFSFNHARGCLSRPAAASAGKMTLRARS